MNKILVPTDFSDSADKALRFAITIANQLESEITLYHIYKVGTSAASKFKTTVDEIIQKDKTTALEKVIEQYRPSLKKGSILGQIAMGDIEDLIIGKSRKEKFDLVIMGSEGEGGLGKFLFGSSSLEVSRRSKVPVVVVPLHAAVQPIRRIILAVDGTGVSDSKLLHPLVELARQNNAEIEVFHKLMDGEENPELHPSVKAALKGLPYTYHAEETETDDISDSIKDFVERHEGDLLCVIHRRKGLFSRLFKEKVTRDSVTDNAIPMLIVSD